MTPSPLPNNLGPTLLLAVGLLSSPLGVGVPLVIVALAGVRTAAGDPALPRLTLGLQRLRRGLFLPAPLRLLPEEFTEKPGELPVQCSLPDRGAQV